MIIHNAIVHNLVKVQNTREATARIRPTPLVLSEPLQSLVEAVHEAYSGRSGKSYGAFQDDATLHPAQTLIGQLLTADSQDGASFVAMTRSLMALLVEQARKEQFATGGHVVMADVADGATRWFLIAILTDVAGSAINADLEVVSTTHLDLSAMRYAGRVNLTDWANGVERYISFLRGKKVDVAEYFQSFIGVSTLLKPLAETQRLVAVIKTFAADRALSEPVRERLLADVHEVCMSSAAAGLPLELDALANRVWPDVPAALQSAFGRAEPPLPDGFVPDRRGLLGLRKFKAKAANWSLEFDRSAMADNTIRYEAASRRLTISGIPDDIAEKLNREFAQDDNPATP